jgi:hypothetical protein
MVVLPVAIAGALDTRALCCSTFVIIGAIVVAIAINVPMLLLAIGHHVKQSCASPGKYNACPCVQESYREASF